jgi:hypothetical protein
LPSPTVTPEITATPDVDGVAIDTSPSPTPQPQISTIGFQDMNFERLETVDAHVLGAMTLAGTLKAQGNAEFSGEVLFGALVEFGGSVSFEQDVTFTGRPIFSNDTAGTTRIPAGERRVDIVFSEPYAAAPVVTANLAFEELTENQEERILAAGYTYMVSRRSVTGFSIILNKAVAEEDAELSFSWMALAVPEEKEPAAEPAQVQETAVTALPPPAQPPESSPEASLEPSLEPPQPTLEAPPQAPS